MPIALLEQKARLFNIVYHIMKQAQIIGASTHPFLTRCYSPCYYMDSKLVLIIQLNGVFLITILSFFLRRSVRVQALKYWTVAWLCLSVSLICLRLAFSFSDLESLLLTYYFLGQYIFGYMLVIGCRTLNGL